MRLASLLLSVTIGCYDPPEEQEVTCVLVAACGLDGWSNPVPFFGTPEEIAQAINEWTAACNAIYQPQYRDGTCEIVFCGAFCRSNWEEGE